MRPRDPRRLLPARRTRDLARVRIIEEPEAESPRGGAITSRQAAEVTLPRAELERIWNPEYLERLARTYWRYLTRISLGMLRVLYKPDSRAIVFLARPFTLLRFQAPEYETEPDCGSVTWRIDRGILVAPPGRGNGYLKITVEREPGAMGEEVIAHVSSEVANFYPMLAGWGWFSKIGRYVYRNTQLRLHVLVTHGFLRSLATLDLEESAVGALRRTDVGRQTSDV